MSALKAAISSAASRSPGSNVDLSAKELDKYRLLITAGPSYDTSTHKIVHVNTDTPTYIENEYLRAKVKVRIRGFRGLPSKSPSSSPYFDDAAHEKDQYSVAFSFVPKQDIPSLNAVWGNDFDHPVRDRLPPGFNTAFRIVKEFIDPGLECDAYADEPWLYGPALSCWFGFRIGEKSAEGEEINEAVETNDVLQEGADGSGREFRDRHGLPANSEKRRKFFLSKDNRESFVFEKGRLYSADFFNPYLDFGNFALKLPGFSIKVIKYIDEKSHSLRYVFKNRKTGELYLCINFNLLWGEHLQKALRDDEQGAEEMKAWAGADTDGYRKDTGEPEATQAGEGNAPNGDTEGPKLPPDMEGPKLPPGLVDKPESLRRDIQAMSMQDMLRQSSSVDERGGKSHVFDDELD